MKDIPAQIRPHYLPTERLAILELQGQLLHAIQRGSYSILVEDRFIAVGNTPSGTIVAVFTEPAEDVVRILSERPATPREQYKLEAYWRGENG